MYKFCSGLSVAAVSLLFTMSSSAAVLDDFNRANSATLGANWTQVSGSSSITNNKASGSGLALAVFNGGTGNTVSFDISNNGSSTQYVAAVIGFGSDSDYFVKVQNNGGSLFNAFGFYKGNNNGSSGSVFGSLTSGFSSGHVVVSVQDMIATLTITPNVGAAQVYSHNYGVSFNGGAIGLGWYGAANVDNFGNGDKSNAIPEPATAALLGLGLLGFATSRRKLANSRKT